MTFNHGVEGSNPSRRTQHSYRGMDRVNEVGFHTPKRLKCSVRVNTVASSASVLGSIPMLVRINLANLEEALRVRVPPSHLNEKQSEILLSFRARLTIALFSLGGTSAGAPLRACAEIPLYHRSQILSSVFLKNFLLKKILKFRIFYLTFVAKYSIIVLSKKGKRGINYDT